MIKKSPHALLKFALLKLWISSFSIASLVILFAPQGAKPILSIASSANSIAFIANAQTPSPAFQTTSQMDLSVSPPTAYIKVQPGSSNTHTITLENTGDNTVTVSPQIVDFKPDGKTGIPQLQNKLSFPYLDIPDGGFGTVTLEAKQTAQLTLKFKVPVSAPIAEYPLTIIFHQQNNGNNVENDQNLSTTQNTNNRSFSDISGSIASNLIVLIADKELKPQLKILKVQTRLVPDSLQSLVFQPIIENSGVSAAAASGSATIINWRNQEVAKFEIFPEIILGGSTRQAHAIASPPDLPLLENGQSQIEPGPFEVDKFLLGPYVIKINLTQTDEQGNVSNIATVSKLIISVPYIGVALLLIVILILIGMQRRNRWVIKSRLPD